MPRPHGSGASETSPPTVPAHTAHSAPAAAGSPRWTSRVATVNVTVVGEPARTSSGRFCVTSAMPNTSAGERDEPDDEADGALHGRGPRRMASGSSPPSRRPPDGGSMAPSRRARPLLGGAAGGRP